MGVGRLDRRDQFGDHCRQSAKAAACANCDSFWDTITERKIWPFTPDGDIFRKARNAHSCLVTSVAGPAGLFQAALSQSLDGLTGATTATSYYDTEPLRNTLD